jgi:hypothetical protein
MDALEMGFAAATLENGDVEVNVPIPRSYEAAINDAVYGMAYDNSGGVESS